MKGKDVAITVLVVVAGIFAALFIVEKLDNIELKKKNDDLLEDKLKLLRETLDKKNAISPEIKTQIEKLIEYYQKHKPSVSHELRDVLLQIQNGQDVKAIRDLAKIIENLLKDKFRNEPRFINMKVITLKPLIEFAKETKLFNEKLYHSACILHQFRNEESHELAVQDTENMKLTALIGGLEIIRRINPN
jgi:hypothetical protein